MAKNVCTLRVCAALAAALLALPSFALAQGALEGRVTAQMGGDGVSGAQVAIPAAGVSISTAQDGSYSVDGIPAGTHSVEFRRLGFATAVRQVTIRDGETTTLNVTLGVQAVALEGLIAVGTRGDPRTATESAVPIDVLSGSELAAQGITDITDALRNVAPSFNVNAQPISDASTIARPANVRGLAPDHTLVLLNGKRRHRSAVIYWLGGGVSDGAQGPDISPIPSIALRQVEVLRDGAAAQYGSDAIAGVINFELKNASSGGAFEVKAGTTQEGDGDTYAVAGNVGMGLFGGFLNLSGEYGWADPTVRSVQSAIAQTLANAGYLQVRDPAQIWGTPTVEDDTKLFANFGVPLNEDIEFYGHSNYASKKVTGGFFYRSPNDRIAVFVQPGKQQALIGDARIAAGQDVPMGQECPVVNILNGVPDQVAMAEVFARDECFSFEEKFPGGFTPQFGGDARDMSGLAGFRGTLGNGIGWDLSASYGQNEVDFFIYNTVNASMGPDSPTSFDPGLYRQEEINLNLNLAKQVSDRLHLAGGAEWRQESFTIGQGEMASWTFGPYAGQGFSAASNGFPGFSPIAEGSWDRNNVGVYGDAELAGEDNAWTLGAAVRFENFSDFGSTLNGKFQGRYQVSDAGAFRASISTGFRAPTPGQQNAFNVSTVWDEERSDLVNRGTIPSTSAAAELKGGMALAAEKSTNYAIGVVVDQGVFTMSLDFFQIDLRDRLSQTRTFALTQAEIDQLVAEGITSASNLAEFRFFTNDFSTSSRGLDFVVAAAVTEITTLSLAYNYTNTRVTERNEEQVDDDRVMLLEGALPESRLNVTATHQFGFGLTALGRLSHYGSFWDDQGDGAIIPAEQVVDLELAYPVTDNIRFVMGSQNILNNYPRQYADPWNRNGRIYTESSPFGFNGAIFYSKLSYIW